MEKNLDDLPDIIDLLLSFAFLGHYCDNQSDITKRVLYDAGKTCSISLGLQLFRKNNYKLVRFQTAKKKVNMYEVTDFVDRLSDRKEDWAKFQLLRSCFESENGVELPSKFCDRDERERHFFTAATLMFRNEEAATQRGRRSLRLGSASGVRVRHRVAGAVEARALPRPLGGEGRLAAGVPEAPALHGRRCGVPGDRQHYSEVRSSG